MTQSHDVPAVATPALVVEPLLVKDLRGLLNHLVTSDTINAYMAILQRSRPRRICFVTSYISALFANGLSSRWVTRAALLVQATPKLFIPWHIPTGIGHFIHGIADFGTGRLEVFDPLRPRRRGTASGRHVTQMLRFVAVVSAASGHDHVWTAAWGHTGKQSGVDCGVHVMLGARREAAGRSKGHCLQGSTMRPFLAAELEAGHIDLTIEAAGLLPVFVRPPRRRRGGRRGRLSPLPAAHSAPSEVPVRRPPASPSRRIGRRRKR